MDILKPNPKPKNTAYTFKIEEEKLNKLRKLARLGDLSIATILRRLVDQFLSEYESKTI